MNNKKGHKPRPETKTHYTIEEAISHLQSRVVIAESGCHEWQGPRTRDGYGQLGEYWLIEQYGIKLVHRLMVHLVTGHEFADRSEQVMHSCHNRSCCNPDHLSIGTAKENIRQAWERGSFDGFWRRHRPNGELNGRVKVTEDQVREIRRRAAAGEKRRTLSRDFDIHYTTVTRILAGETWRHIL